MIAIIVGKMMLLFFVSSWIIIHLGMNPERGGRPPSESIVVKISVEIIGILFQRSDSDSVVVDELKCNSINTVIVSRI